MTDLEFSNLENTSVECNVTLRLKWKGLSTAAVINHVSRRKIRDDAPYRDTRMLQGFDTPTFPLYLALLF